MTTYIESKLNPDGTYDHSEVIEAHKKGSMVECLLDDCEGQEWVPVKSARWHLNVKYRAVIEDKPIYPKFFKQYNERFQNRLHEENRMKAAAVIDDKEASSPDMRITWDDYKNGCSRLGFHIKNKFQSGNAIPVERITLTRAEVNEVFPGLLK